MKHDYGASTIEIPATVAILDGDAAQPIYHRSEPAGREGCSWFARRTSCGRIIFAQQDDLEPEHHGFEIPARHAVRFGRPCLTCWPELRRQQSLFARPHRATRAEQEALEV